jgi:hypothetical protein
MEPCQMENPYILQPVIDVDNESSYSSLSEFGDDHLEHCTSDMDYIKKNNNHKELTMILHMYKPKVNKW